MRIKWLLIPLLLTLGLASGGISSSQAQTGTDEWTGLDILFLVDQSGSMGGAAFGQPGRQATDPSGLRFQSMEFAMEWLGDFSHYAQPDSRVRMSVIAFGDPQRTLLLDWTELAPQGSTDDAWERQKLDLRNLLGVDFFGFRNFGYTNFEQAVMMARNQFDSLGILPTGERNLRVLIIISDGEPCAVEDTNPETLLCDSLARNQAQLDRVLQLTRSAFSPNDYQIYFLGIETPQELYWDQYGGTWANITREPNTPARAFVINNAEEMAQRILEMLDVLRALISNSMITLGVPLDAAGNARVYVPPYTRLARFNVFKQVPGTATALTLTKPDASMLSGTDPDVTVSDDRANIEVWTLERPDHGVWDIHVDNPDLTRVDVEIDQVFLQADLIQASNPPIYHQWQSVPLAPYLYYRFNGADVAVDILPAYPIDMTATVEQGAFSRQIALPPATAAVAGNARQPQYAGTFVPLNTGVYTVELVGEVPDAVSPDPAAIAPPGIHTPVNTANAATRETFEVRASAVTVEPDPLLIQRNGDWWQNDPANVCVVVKDAQTGAEITNLDQLTVTVELQQPDGQVVPFPLTYDTAGTNRCTFEGPVAPTALGLNQAFVRGFIPDGQGGEVEVFNHQTVNFTMNVLPVRPIEIVIIEPVDDQQVSPVIQENPFWGGLPMRVQAVTRYADTGELVDLSVLTGSANPLTLSVRDQDLNDVTQPNSVTRTDPATYELRADYAPGSYSVLAQGVPLPRQACGCEYLNGNNEALRTVNRQIPTGFFLWMIGIAVGTLLVVLVLVAAYIRYKGARDNPLTGTLHFWYQSFDEGAGQLANMPLGSLTLTQFNRNEVTRSMRSIIGRDSSIKSLHFSSLKPVTGQPPRIRIKVRTKDKGSDSTQYVTSGGGPVQLHTDANGDTYMVEMDPENVDL